MTKDELIKKIERVHNVYEFTAIIFSYTTTIPKQTITQRYNTLLSSGKTEALNTISNLTKNLCIINPFEFEDWASCWNYEFKLSKIDDIVFCYATLLKIDDIICELLPSMKKLLLKGPLNSNTEWLFYYKKPFGFFSKELAKRKIRTGRQTVEYDSNSINKVFNNFEVIKETSLYDYYPRIKEYKTNYKFSDTIKIGISCLSSNVWFLPKFNKGAKTFTIDYNFESLEIHNDCIRNILLESEKNKVDIVIFPELAMNPQTEEYIKNIFLQSNFQNVKLCFLGSVWNNNTNEAVLITNQGTILIREQKQIPFNMFSKELDDYFSELINSDGNISFIDIEGLGRVAYLICADYNDDSINAICSLLHADFIFVSAFTTDTTLMFNTAKSHAERKAITTILCNSCAAFDDNNTCSAFAVAPKVENRKLIADICFKQNECPNLDKCEFCVKTFIIKKEFT